MTSTRSTLHSIPTTPLTSSHAFVHVILIKIHFSLHFQSVSERIPIPIPIPIPYQEPYHTVRPPKDLPDPCSLVCTCTYGLRRLTGRGTCTSNMYFQTIPPKFPPGIFLAGNETFRQVYKKTFLGGFLNWWPRRIFLGMSRTSLNVHPLTEEDADIPTVPTYLPRYIALPPPPGSSRIYATFFLFESGTEFIIFCFILSYFCAMSCITSKH